VSGHKLSPLKLCIGVDSQAHNLKTVGSSTLAVLETTGLPTRVSAKTSWIQNRVHNKKVKIVAQDESQASVSHMHSTQRFSSFGGMSARLAPLFEKYFDNHAHVFLAQQVTVEE